MTSSLRFQFYIHRFSVIVLPAIVIGVILLCYCLPESDFIAGYYSVLPILPAFAAAGAGMGAFTTQMNLALSMGELRRHFFFASQISALFYALFGTLMILGVLTLDMNARIGFYFDWMSRMSPVTLVFILFANYIVGSALGILISINRTLGSVIFAVIALSIGLLTALGTLFIDNIPTWVSSSTITIIAYAAVTGVCEWLLWRRTQTYAVK